MATMVRVRHVSVKVALLARLKTLQLRLAQLERPVADGHGDEGDRSLAYERHELAADALDRIAEEIGACDAALARIDAGEYGRCAECGKWLAAARLAALPAASLCIDCASHAERVRDGRRRRPWTEE